MFNSIFLTSHLHIYYSKNQCVLEIFFVCKLTCLTQLRKKYYNKKIKKLKIQTCTKQVWELGLDLVLIGGWFLGSSSILIPFKGWFPSPTLVLIGGQFTSVGRFFNFKC
jgi:hypothetical protein